MDVFKTILLTTDFSDTSLRAVDPAVTLARRFGAQLVVVHVDDDRLPPLVVEYMAVGLEDLRRRQHDASRQRLAELVERDIGGDLDVRLEVPLGTPHVEIVRVAQEQRADLIVMATHGREFMSHVIMGSTTERVLRHAPCPVLVVRDPVS